jgi:PAS domain S-box-containing protein
VNEARRDALALLESLAIASQYSVATGVLVDRLETEAQAARVRLAAELVDPERITRSDLAELVLRSESRGLSIWIGDKDPLIAPPELAELAAADTALTRFDWSQSDGGAVAMTLLDTAGGASWLGTGVPTAWGGVMLWDQAEGFLPAPSYGGIGELIQQIAEASEINYIMLQSPEGIVFASRPLEPVLRLVEDSFLVASLEANESATRELIFEGQPVLEAVAPFLSADLPSGMFRVGLSLAGVQAAQDRLTLQLGLTAGLLLLLSFVVIAFLIKRRSLSDLGRSYRRVETMTTRILDSMDQGVVAVDAAGRVTVYNPAAEIITGRNGEELLGRPVSDALGAIDYSLRLVSTGGEPVRDERLQIRRADSTRELVYTTTPMISPDGQSEGAVSIIRDETEARALAEQVRRGERLSEMGHLAAGVAHEIRNPLNAIALAAQRLRLEVGDPEAAKLAGTVWEESKRLNAIIEDYLSLAQPLNQVRERVDLVELVRDLTEMIGLEARKRNVDLAVDVTEDLVAVSGIADELKKALWNVFANALSATPEGGEVTCGLTLTGGQVRLTVDDTGCGIKAEDLTQVFQPYFTTKSGGTGLGLAITDRIINGHEGSIDVVSPVPGTESGTRVVITLPLADDDGRVRNG